MSRSDPIASPSFITPPPDVMGAVGPNHIVLLVNNALVVYNKSDGSVCNVGCSDTPENFFNAPGMYDPRILFDDVRKRWIAVMVSSSTKDVILAVSPINPPLYSPLPLNSWTKITLDIPHPDSNWITDFPTLGYDADGIYIAVAYFDVGKVNWRYRVVAIQATSSDPSITAGKRRYFPPKIVNGVPNYSEAGPPAIPPYRYFTLQPVVNLDSTSGGLSWFVAKGDPTQSPMLYYGKLKWDSNGNPQFLGTGATPWSNSLNLSGMSAYYHIDHQPNFPTLLSFNIPQKPSPSGGTFSVNIASSGSRLAASTVRTTGGTKSLWTCHCIGVNSSGTYTGVTTGLRAGLQWLQLGFTGSGDNQLLTFNSANYGRVYDSASSAPDHYIFPSIGVNANGDIVMGFSASQAGARLSSGFWGRRASGLVFGRPSLLSVGTDFYDAPDFGHYSTTIWDPEPSNSNILWTMQESATTRTVSANYAIRIGRIRLNP